MPNLSVPLLLSLACVLAHVSTGHSVRTVPWLARCPGRPDVRPRVENAIWECVWPPMHEGCMWMIHRTRDLGADVTPGAMLDLYSRAYTPSERRRIIMRSRGGNVTHQTAIAPSGLHNYYHIPARRDLKDNTVLHLDAPGSTMVMLNPWQADAPADSFVVYRRRA